MDITKYITFDRPVPFKGLQIHPVYMKDYAEFMSFSQVLTLEKNAIPDVEIISMSYLKFIYHMTMKDATEYPYLIMLDRLLSLCLQDESFNDIEESLKRYNYTEKGKPFFIINKEVYREEDFNEIKKIICEQNLIELPDPNISKEVRDSLEEAQRYKNKISGTKTGTLEDYIISLSIVTGWTMDYIQSLPIRKFIKAIKRYDNLIHYKIYLSASMSGMVEFKDKSFIKHWLSNIETEDRYKDVTVDLDELKGTISMESAKKKTQQQYK